jgi:hypothetical protein
MGRGRPRASFPEGRIAEACGFPKNSWNARRPIGSAWSCTRTAPRSFTAWAVMKTRSRPTISGSPSSRRRHRRREGQTPPASRAWSSNAEPLPEGRKEARERLEDALRSADGRGTRRIARILARAHALLASVGRTEKKLDAAGRHLEKSADVGRGSPLLLGEIENQHEPSPPVPRAELKTRWTVSAARPAITAPRGRPQAEAIAHNAIAVMEREQGRLHRRPAGGECRRLPGRARRGNPPARPPPREPRPDLHRPWPSTAKPSAIWTPRRTRWSNTAAGRTGRRSENTGAFLDRLWAIRKRPKALRKTRRRFRVGPVRGMAEGAGRRVGPGRHRLQVRSHGPVERRPLRRAPRPGATPIAGFPPPSEAGG